MKRWLFAEKRKGDRVRAVIGDTFRKGYIVRIRNPISRYVQYLVQWDLNTLRGEDGSKPALPELSWMAEDDVTLEKERK